MPVFLSLSPLFLANAITFASSKQKKEKKIFSLSLPCEKPTQTTGKTGYLYAEPSIATAERLSQRQQPKKKQRKIDFSLQPFQTHDLGLIIVITSKRFFRGEDQSPFVSLH